MNTEKILAMMLFAFLSCSSVSGLFAIVTAAPAFIFRFGYTLTSVEQVMQNFWQAVFNPVFWVEVAVTLPTWFTNPTWILTLATVVLMDLVGIFFIGYGVYKIIFRK